MKKKPAEKQKEKPKISKKEQKKMEEFRKKQIDIANKFKETVINKYKKFVKAVIIFGSFTRGDFHSKSDIDMLLINGEELIGAKQNRTVNVSIVVPAQEQSQ